MKILLALLFLSITACAEDTEPSIETADVAVESGKADTNGEIRLRSAGLTVWMRPNVETVDFDGSYWRVRGRTSRNLQGLSARVGETPIRADQLSARKFEIRVNANVVEESIIDAMLVTVETSAGLHTIRIRLQPRIDHSKGSSYIYPYKRIDLVAVEGEAVFRATVSTRKDFEWLQGWNDDDSEPLSARVTDRKFHLDFYPGYLTWASHPYEDALVLAGDATDGRSYRRDAFINMSIGEFGLTNGNPKEVWPSAECDEDGSAREQIACGPQTDPDQDWIQHFAQDFRSHLIGYYRIHEADIVAAGGNKRTEALVIVDSADIYEITDPDEDPNGHNLDDVRVFAHPDVVFPGSDNVWFGAYRKSDGSLIAIYDFN